MSAPDTPTSPSSPLDSLLTSLATNLKTYKSNLLNQTHTAFSRLTAKDVIRLVIIVGAYALLRPYLLKLGGKFQEQDHERADKMDMAEVERLRRADGGGSLKVAGEIPEDTDSEDEAEGRTGKAKGTGMDWGKTARRRQRRVLRGLLEEEERRRREEEEATSDKEIEDLLTGDY
ncbi:hypothetical protein MMC10_009776 [Thelotrema lepadinum]|nr:hypothetical protein [Thelotrema lepadinum]